MIRVNKNVLARKSKSLVLEVIIILESSQLKPSRTRRITYKSSQLLARNHYYLLALRKSLAYTKSKGITYKVNERNKSSRLIVIRVAKLKRLTTSLGWQVQEGQEQARQGDYYQEQDYLILYKVLTSYKRLGYQY